MFTLPFVRSRSDRPTRGTPSRRRGASPCLEHLEHRVSLSSFSAGVAMDDLNPQPIPPGRRSPAMIKHGNGPI